MKNFKLKIFISIYILLLCVFSYSFSYAKEYKEYIKVGILSNQKSLNIASDKKYYFMSGNKKYKLSAGKITVNPLLHPSTPPLPFSRRSTGRLLRAKSF